MYVREIKGRPAKQGLLFLQWILLWISTCVAGGLGLSGCFKQGDGISISRTTGSSDSILSTDDETDKANKGLPKSGPPKVTFQEFKSIIDARCLTCHGAGSGNGDFAQFADEKAWTDSPYINLNESGNDRLISSPIIARISGNGLDVPSANMPKNLPQIPSAEIEKIKNYILGIFSGTEGGSGETEIPFSCNPGTSPSDSPLKRLTKTEYVNSIRDALRFIGNSSIENAVFNNVSAKFTLIPEESTEEISGINDGTSQDHMDGYFEVGVAIGDALVPYKNTLLHGCASYTTPSCVRNLIRDFGKLIYRRPLTTVEIEFYYSAYLEAESDNESNLFAILFSAPQFIYHLEDQGIIAGSLPGTYALTPYELASRLSFHFWKTMPDSALFAAAELPPGNSASLMNESGYQAQVDRLFSDTRSDQSVKGFFNEWLELKKTPDVRQSNANEWHYGYAGEIDIFSNSDIYKDMISEIENLGLYYTKISDSPIESLFNSDISLAESTGLAQIYGVPQWNGSFNTSALRRFPAGERTGLLTRGALLASNEIETNPIVKGVRIRRKLLCDNLPPPPPGVVRPDTLVGLYTKREKVTAQTSDALCMTCHKDINHFGFATEDYDSLGRHRDQEQVFLDSNSRDFTGIDIDSTALANVFLGDTREVNSGIELNSAVGSSYKLKACVARNYFRYTYKRYENTVEDGCQLESIRNRLKSGTIKEFFKNIALDPMFKLRKPGA